MPRHKLTDKGLRGLKPPVSGQADYWDTLTPGFGGRVGHGGRKSFIVLTRIDRHLRRFTLKPSYPALTLAEARDASPGAGDGASDVCYIRCFFAASISSLSLVRRLKKGGPGQKRIVYG